MLSPNTPTLPWYHHSITILISKHGVGIIDIFKICQSIKTHRNAVTEKNKMPIMLIIDLNEHFKEYFYTSSLEYGDESSGYYYDCVLDKLGY